MEMRFGPVGGIWKAAIGALALCAALPALAADELKPGDASQGEQKFYTCYGCHGIEGYRNAYPNYEVPKLRHQHAEYIIAALTEYRAGDRPHSTMHAQAASLSDQDIADIAAYLQGPEPIKPAPPEGHAPKVVATCAACHGEDGSGVAAPLTPKPPVLAGQHVDYLEQALAQYRNGRRKNGIMGAMSKSISSDADIRTIAEYYASQHSALATATENSR
jgi:cytochrome c553